MSSREKILSAIIQTDTKPTERPITETKNILFENPLEAFMESLKSAGGEAVIMRRSEVDEKLKELHDKYNIIVDARKKSQKFPEKLENTELLILEGEFAVAENGAVWINPKDKYPRELLTLAENIIIIVEKDSIVSTMQEAYARLDFSDISYALFLSGPSKTADIEQALVIGAHGAIGMKVFLI